MMENDGVTANRTFMASHTESTATLKRAAAMSEASEKTQFKIGNHAWKARGTHGRKPIFSNPDVLQSACEEYFEWCCENPILSVELVKWQGIATQVQVPRMRAMTIAGLCNFLEISTSTWSNYRRLPDFLEVTERVESIIYQQKFEGAAADMLNANIISRELGLADKQAVNTSGAILHIGPEHTGLEFAGDILFRRRGKVDFERS